MSKDGKVSLKWFIICQTNYLTIEIKLFKNQSIKVQSKMEENE
jgi:hypothetical protein